MSELMDMLRWVILGVKTCEVFFVFYIVATSYSYR